jgi:hypothetical protein
MTPVQVVTGCIAGTLLFLAPGVTFKQEVGPEAERIVAAWAAEVRDERAGAQAHEATGTADVELALHPCDEIPVPGPGPVLLTAATMSHCREIAPWFDPGDLFRALVTVECESNGDPWANDHWQGKVVNPPYGLWSILGSWHGEARSMFGTNWDPYSTTDSSRFAAWLVYDTPGGWNHWWSCNELGVDETVRRY